MKRILSLTLALALLLVFSGCSLFVNEEEAFDVEECLEEAEELVEEGKLEEAEKLLKKGIRKADDSEDLEDYLEIVQALMEENDTPTAGTTEGTEATTEATQQPTGSVQPVVPSGRNMLDRFSSDDMYKINVFLSNFSEQNFKEYPCGDERMIHFGYIFAKINGGGMVYSEPGYYCVSKSDMDYILNRFFGKTVDLQDPCTVNGPYNNWCEYRGGVYYFPAADGEGYGYCSVATSMVDNGNGTYTVTFNVYSHVNPHESMSPYYSMTPAQAAGSSDLVLKQTGTAVVRDYIRNGGIETYQLISYQLN